MNTYKEIKERIDQIEKEYMAELYELETKATEFRKARSEAMEKAAKAREAMDMQMYHEAQQEKRNAEDCEEMLNSKADAIRKSPHITESEARSIETEIREIAKNYTNHLQDEFEEVAARAIEIEKECGELFAEGNSLLGRLQHGLMLDDACYEASDGRRFHSDALEKRLDGFDPLVSLTVKINDAVGGYRQEETRKRLTWGRSV